MKTPRFTAARLLVALACTFAALVCALPGVLGEGLGGPSAGLAGAAVEDGHAGASLAPAATSTSSPAGGSTGAGAVDLTSHALALAPADAWRQAAPHMAGTYLPEIVAAGDARVKRWVDRTGAPVRVWVAPGDSVPGWRLTFGMVVREAFGAWERIGLPVRFAFVDSPEDAEVHVAWTERLDGQTSGVVQWRADADGWLTQASIVLATWVSDGGRADEASIRRIALHEIGHLLGLEHSADGGDVMAAWVNAGDLSERDRATARLLYTLPPGAISAEWRTPDWTRPTS
jgi:hypothetical protein